MTCTELASIGSHRSSHVDFEPIHTRRSILAMTISWLDRHVGYTRELFIKMWKNEKSLPVIEIIIEHEKKHSFRFQKLQRSIRQQNRTSAPADSWVGNARTCRRSIVGLFEANVNQQLIGAGRERSTDLSDSCEPTKRALVVVGVGSLLLISSRGRSLRLGRETFSRGCRSNRDATIRTNAPL